jgi:hypothetical protein
MRYRRQKREWQSDDALTNNFSATDEEGIVGSDEFSQGNDND